MKKFIILIVVGFLVFLGVRGDWLQEFQTQDLEPGESISRGAAIATHWDEIRQYLGGIETIRACPDGGMCEGVDADINEGQIEVIYFDNGDYLFFIAEIHENGEASDADDNGVQWDFTLDMNSTLVDVALEEWASEKGYIIE